MRRTAVAAIAGLLLAGATAVRAADTAAAPPAAADADFLEYLGSWDGSDADWQVMAADTAAVRQATGAKDPTSKTVANATPSGADAGGTKQEQQ